MTTTTDRVLAELAAYDLKPKGPNKYRCNSPLRPGSNSHAFALTVDPDGEHGTFYDHVAKEGGSLYDLADHFGIARPNDTPMGDTVTTKRPYASLAEYAHAQHTPVDEFTGAGWKDVAPYPHFPHMNRPALQFTTTTGTRWRFTDGKNPVYMSPKEYRRCWYGLERAVLMAEATGQPLVICNGEASTIAAQYHAVAATAITGGGENGIPDGLLNELKSTYRGPVLIALDCDLTGRTGATKMLATLQSAGYDVRAVDLNGEPGFDLANFCGLHKAGSADALLALHDLGTTEQTAPVRFWLTEDEIDTLRPPTWLVKGVVPAGEVTMVIGQSDAGKTFLVVDMAKRVAQHYPVMYIAAEDAPGIRVRKRAWELHHATVPNGNFLMMNSALNLFDATAVDGFVAGVRDLGLKMIVIDTLSQSAAAFGADENSNTHMAIVMAHCERIAHQTGAAVVLLHHTTKDGGTWRGASAIRGNTYGLLEVSKDDESIKLECGRIKNTKPFDPRFFKLREIETNILDEQGNAITNCVIVPGDRIIMGDRLTRSQKDLLETVLVIADAQGGAKPTEMLAMCKLPAPSFYRALKRLRDLGFVSKGDKHTDPYDVTPSGRERLAQVSNDPALQIGDAVSPTTPPFEVNPNLGKMLSNASDSTKMLSNGSESNSGATYHPATSPEAVTITPLNAALVDCDAVTITPLKMLSKDGDSTDQLLSITPTALAGRDDSNRNKESENRTPPQGESDVPHDQKRTKEARTYLHQGDYKRARTTADTVRGRKDRLLLLAEIAHAEAATGGVE